MQNEWNHYMDLMIKNWTMHRDFWVNGAMVKFQPVDTQLVNKSQQQT